MYNCFFFFFFTVHDERIIVKLPRPAYQSYSYKIRINIIIVVVDFETRYHLRGVELRGRLSMATMTDDDDHDDDVICVRIWSF